MKKLTISLGPEDGQAVILVVAAMSLFLFGALGLAIDGGQMYAHRQMAQVAADAAAQAGIMSIFRGTNATSAPSFGTGTPPISSYICTTVDLRTPCVYARDNGFGATTADTVTLSYPTTVSGVALSPAPVPALTVTVRRTLRTGLIRFVGMPATSSITAKGTAGLVGAVSTDCIYVLDPSASGSFTANNGANVAVTGCAIAVNSSSSTAAILSATVTAPELDIVGACNCTQTYPTLKTGQVAITDPFLSLPVPAIGACTKTTMYSPASNTTVPPGNYCGGISVGNGATNVVFSPGDFIITGGGLTFGGGATASGSGVMFYLTGTNSTYASVNVGNGISLNLSAPTSGTYLGVLFFQDRTITSGAGATFAGGATMQLSGSLYFPTTSVSFSNGTSAEANDTAIIAKQVSFQGGARIQYDSTGLKTGLFSTAVALVQ
jgi:hypothetical protein